MNAENRPVEIVRVESDRELMEFIKFPWKVYRDDPHWVPPLIKDQKKFLTPANPFFQHAEAEYYLARRGSTTCGRISVSIDNNYIGFHGEKMGCFGFLEMFNDFEVASRLLDTARKKLSDKGMAVMRGPFNFAIKDEWGMLVDGFGSDPMVRISYNPPYYVDLVEKYGLTKVRDYYSYILTLPQLDISYVRKLAEKAAGNRVVARKLNLKDTRGEMKRVQEVVNDAHSRDWGFVPLTDAEIEEVASHLKALVIDDLGYIGEIDGKPIGFLLFMPDYNVVLRKMNGKMGILQVIQFLWHKNRIKTGRFFLAGVRKDYHRTGVAAAMAVKVFESAIRRGFTSAELSRILEDNVASRSIAELAGGKVYKTHRIYEMSLAK